MAKKTEPSILFYNRNLRFQKRSLRLQEQRLRLQITFNVSRLYKKEEGVSKSTPSFLGASCITTHPHGMGLLFAIYGCVSESNLRLSSSGISLNGRI